MIDRGVVTEELDRIHDMVHAFYARIGEYPASTEPEPAPYCTCGLLMSKDVTRAQWRCQCGRGMDYQMTPPEPQTEAEAHNGTAPTRCEMHESQLRALTDEQDEQRRRIEQRSGACNETTRRVNELQQKVDALGGVGRLSALESGASLLATNTRDELDGITGRISKLEDDMPTDLAWSHIIERIDKLEERLTEVDGLVETMRTSGWSDVTNRISALEQRALATPAQAGPDEMTASRLDAHDNSINHIKVCIADFERKLTEAMHTIADLAKPEAH